MEEVRGFQKGLNTDINPMNQGDSTYRDALNVVQVSEEGNIYALTNEQGTINQQVTFPDGFQYIGHTVLDSDILVCLAHASGYSQIGVIDADMVYTRAIPEPNDVAGDTNDEIGFEISDKVDLIARKLFTGDRVVYWAIEGKDLGYASIDNPPATGDITDNIKLIPNQNIPNILFSSIKEDAGNLRVGAYQFVTRYYTEDLTPTSFGTPCNIIPIVNNQRGEGRNKYDGEYQDVGVVSKNIIIDINNIDTSFAYLEVVVIFYENVTNTFVAEAHPLISITEETDLTFVYSGQEEDVRPVLKEEIRTIPVSYSSAKAVTQKDNVIFFSNLRDSSIDFDQELQEYFNDVEVRYKIKEIEFNETSNAPTAFEPIDLPYIVDIATATPVDTIALSYTSAYGSAAADTATYTLKSSGVPAVGIVKIDNIVNLIDAAVFDEIEVEGVNFVATNGAVTPGDATFDARVDEATASASLVDQINAHATTSAIVGAYYDTGTLSVVIIASTVGTVGNAYALNYVNSGGLVGATVTSVFSGGVDQIEYPTDSVTLVSDVKVELVYTLPEDLNPSYTLKIDTADSASGGETYNSGGFLEISGFPTAETFAAGGDVGGFGDYKGESLTFYSKGYRRDEVYSFAGVMTFADGSPSYAYHIPGSDKTAAGLVLAAPDTPGALGEVGGDVGTYVSDLFYPSEQYYPGNALGDDNSLGAGNRKIKHHKMPSLEQEPHFRRIGDKTYIRILGLEFKFKKALTPLIAAKIQSITLTRERRNTGQNKSMYAQGLVNRYIQTSNEYDVDSGAAIASGRVVKKMPFFNNTVIDNESVRVRPATSVRTQFLPSIAFEYNLVTNDVFNFISPDTLLNDVNPNDIIGARVKPALTLEGNIYYSSFQASEVISEGLPGNVHSYPHKYYKGFAYCDYVTYSTPIDFTSVEISASQYIAKGEAVDITGLPNKLDNSTSSRHLFIKADQANLGFGNGAAAVKCVFRSKTMINSVGTNLGSNTYRNEDRLEKNTGNGISNNLMNIVMDNPQQYGDIGGATFIPILTSAVAYTIPNSSLTEVFGGDTFISKVAFRNSDTYTYRGIDVTQFTWPAAPLATTFTPKYTDDKMSQHSAYSGKGMDLRSFQYFFVESYVNCNYRHQLVSRDVTPNIDGPNYYPKDLPLAVLDTFPDSGDATSYNTQYSFENNVKTFNTKTSQASQVASYETRTIYSNPTSEDARADNYRLIPQNNYYDLPKHTGEIWDNFVHANTLFLHTPKSLWRTFVNNTTHQATDIGQVILGTGGLFTIPAQQVVTASGGYGGSISQFGGVDTPHGYVFPDALQGKVFLLVGDQMQEISNKGLQQFFNDDLGEGLISGADYIDNPFVEGGKGIVGGFDFELKRMVMTKKGTTSDFTFSFSFLSQAWISKHSYSPTAYLTMNNKMYSWLNDDVLPVSLHEHNNGEFANFYSEVFPSELKMVFNANSPLEKVFDNFVIHSKTVDGQRVVLLDTWDEVQVNTDIKNSGVYQIIPTSAFGITLNIGELKARRIKNKFQISVPLDAVLDDLQDTLDPSNLDQTQLWKPRMKGDHMTASFKYNNSDNFKFIVNFIACIYRANSN